MASKLLLRRSRNSILVVVIAMVVLSGCLAPERAAHIDDVITRSYRTVFGRAPNRGARADWTDRLAARPYHQWLVAMLMDTPEYARGLGARGTDDFLTHAYLNARGRGPDSAARAWWRTRIASGARSRLDLLVHLVENVGPPIDDPAPPVPCRHYSGGGPVVPRCRPGSPGTTRDAVFVPVPGTNTTVNIALLPRMWAFLDAAHRAGVPVDANGYYGSARTWEMQNYLYTHGYPASPPGRSMHEWGLALDIACAGRSWSASSGWCRQWVQDNAATYGFAVHAREAWHWSTTGRSAGGPDPERVLTPS